jgi:hypothetical protein
MDSAKLLIIGGVALGGFYLLNKNKKDKEKAQILVLQNNQPQTATLSQLEVESKPNKQAIITPQEATAFATKTIAEVNSLMVKYPPLTSQQFLENYNKTYGTNLTMSGDAIIGFSFVAPNQPQVPSAPISTTSKWGGLINSVLVLNNNQATAILESDAMASNANSQFKGQQMIYTRWKSDFATVYSDLKNYYSTLTKEQADFIIKYLPKMIIQAFMGDNDPRARTNDFYSQEEIIDMVDNSFVKDTEEILRSALKQFSQNLSGNKTALTSQTITVS